MHLVGHGRTAALLAGPNPKKRKLNEIGAEVSKFGEISELEKIRMEKQQMQMAMASLQAENQLIKHQLS